MQNGAKHVVISDNLSIILICYFLNSPLGLQITGKECIHLKRKVQENKTLTRFSLFSQFSSFPSQTAPFLSVTLQNSAISPRSPESARRNFINTS